MSPAKGVPTATLSSTPSGRSGLEFLAGGGEMGARMRAFDWSETPLGPPERWPQSLKTIVRVMLDSRYAMWMLWGPELTFFCNDAYLPTLGIKRSWALGARSDKVWQEIWPDLEPRVAQVLEHGRATWDEALLLFLERSGFPEETYHTFSYSPVYDDDNHIAGMLCVVTEVSDRVVGERRLRILRDLAARAVGASSVEDSCCRACEVLNRYPVSAPFAAIYLFDSGSDVARRVAQTRELSGNTLPPTLDPATSIWPLSRLSEVDGMLQVRDLPALGIKVPAGPWPDLVRDAFLLPLKSPGVDRLAGFVIAAASPRRVLDEAYRAFFGLVAGQIASAITEAQAMEAERQRLQALAEIDRAKTTFFSNVSHEFRTPLTLILGPIEEALLDAATPPAVHAQMELAHRNSLRLLKLVNSLLDFARIEAGRMEVSFHPVDLTRLTADLASTFRSAMARAGLSYTVNCEDLGEVVHIDPLMWEKIVLNLLSNAFKFTLEGSVSVSLRCQAGRALLEISDTGVGVPAHELPRLFERFHRAEGIVGRTQEGSGIGLALVQELVKLQGGEIDAVSEPGVGTTFRISMPLGTTHTPPGYKGARAMPASTPLAMQVFVQEAMRWVVGDSEELPSGGALASARGCQELATRILLADDNADMRRYVQDLLSPLYTIETVADGTQALAAARRSKPDLVISDIMMPGLGGLGLLKALRADESLRDLPVILLSARAGEEARVEGLDAGADDYLIKPFSARELLVRISARLELVRTRRSSAHALREREEQLRLATEAGEVGLWDVDVLTDTLYWPPRVKAMFGIGPEIPVTMADFYAGLHPADHDRTVAAYEAAIDPKRRALYDVEYRTVGRGDELVRWVAAKGRGIFDDQGRCIRMIGTAIDISSRKRVEERLREETRVQELLAKVSHALVAAQLDAERVVQVATDAATELSGAAFGAFFYNVLDERGESYTLYSLSGVPKGAFSRFPMPRNTAVFAPTFSGESVVRSADITADPRYGANKPHHGMPDGHLPVRSYLAVPVKTVSGLVLGGMFFGHPQAGMFDDRAERLVLAIAAQAAVAFDNARLHQATQQEIRQRREIEAALDEANRRKDEFLATLGHELRNPLAPIRTAAELLRLTPLDSTGETACDIIERQLRHLARLVDDILDVSRITTGRIVLNREQIDLSEVLSFVIESCRTELDAAKHVFSVQMPEQPVHVRGDRVRLTQLFVNVLGNAAKYTPPGGDIDISLALEAEMGVVRVRDNGIGIPPSMLQRVFDLFAQVDQASGRQGSGLGIGLHLAKKLVELHEGSIEACSAGAQQGSEFVIRLPTVMPSTPAEVRLPPVAAERGKRLKVLLADDNIDAALSLNMLLQRLGHETQLAYEGATAVMVADVFQPDVVILDLGMPVMDGYEACRQIGSRPWAQRTVTVALTGWGQPSDQERTRQAGFDHHLTKPVEIKDLRSILEAAAEISAVQ